MKALKEAGITKCPHCRMEFDNKGFCGCETPFSLNAIPQPALDGIARTILPRIVACVEGLSTPTPTQKREREQLEMAQAILDERDFINERIYKRQC